MSEPDWKEEYQKLHDDNWNLRLELRASQDNLSQMIKHYTRLQNENERLKSQLKQIRSSESVDLTLAEIVKEALKD